MGRTCSKTDLMSAFESATALWSAVRLSQLVLELDSHHSPAMTARISRSGIVATSPTLTRKQSCDPRARRKRGRRCTGGYLFEVRDLGCLPRIQNWTGLVIRSRTSDLVSSCDTV